MTDADAQKLAWDHARDLRSRRREVARRLHPDVGGDPVEFDRAMRALESPPAATTARPTATGHDIVVVPSTRTRLRRRVVATRADLTARLNTHLGHLARLTRRAP